MENKLNALRREGTYFVHTGNRIYLNINAASSVAADLGVAVQNAKSMEFGWWRSSYNVWIVARIKDGDWYKFSVCPIRDYWSYKTSNRISVCATDQETNEIMGCCSFSLREDLAQQLQSDLSIAYESATCSQTEPERVLADFAGFNRLTVDGHMARIRRYYGVSVFD